MSKYVTASRTGVGKSDCSLIKSPAVMVNTSSGAKIKRYEDTAHDLNTRFGRTLNFWLILWPCLQTGNPDLRSLTCWTYESKIGWNTLSNLFWLPSLLNSSLHVDSEVEGFLHTFFKIPWFLVQDFDLSCSMYSVLENPLNLDTGVQGMWFVMIFQSLLCKIHSNW